MTNWYDNVQAPVDANSELVPLDTRELVYKGETRGVLGITYNVGLALWVAILAGMDAQVCISSCTLPDSWERLEKDVYHLVMSEYLDTPEDDVKGIVRRAKALAGVDDGE